MPESTLSFLCQEIPGFWSDTYDIAIPFGDRREVLYGSVWTFDLDQDVLFHTRSDGSSMVPLSLARERLLTSSDFVPLSLPPPPAPSSHSFAAPYWNVQIGDVARETSFLGRILQDFAHTWRHVLRRRQNRSTFLRLAVAVVWISSLDFTVIERTDWDHSPGGLYAQVSELPQWPCPNANFVKSGRTWFALFEDPDEGMRYIRQHHARQTSEEAPSKGNSATYVLLSLRHIVLVRAEKDGTLESTKPEVLFNGEDPPSSHAIDLLLWATKKKQEPSALNSLPVELQDRILFFTSHSSVAAAKMGCDIGLGSPFTWSDGGRALELEPCKRKRTEFSPVESLIYFGPWMSAVSYKPRRRV